MPCEFHFVLLCHPCIRGYFTMGEKRPSYWSRDGRTRSFCSFMPYFGTLRAARFYGAQRCTLAVPVICGCSHRRKRSRGKCSVQEKSVEQVPTTAPALHAQAGLCEEPAALMWSAPPVLFFTLRFDICRTTVLTGRLMFSASKFKQGAGRIRYEETGEKGRFTLPASLPLLHA